MKKTFLIPVITMTMWVIGPVCKAQIAPRGQFISFNGLNQHMVIQNHSDFNIATGESFTITCLVNPQDFDSTYCILSKGNEMMPGGRFELMTHTPSPDANFGFILRNSEGNDLGTNHLMNLETGRWVHFAWVYKVSDKSSNLFVDGLLVRTIRNQAIGRSAISNRENLILGCSLTDASSPFKHGFWTGKADNLRIWKRALSEKEVSNDCTAILPAQEGLVAAYDFENISGNVVPDISGKGHNAILFGYDIGILTTQLPVGAGELNERLIGCRIYSAASGNFLKEILIDLAGTDDIRDISILYLYLNRKGERFDPATAKLSGTWIPTGRKFKMVCNVPLETGDNYFWITAGINPLATEGNSLKASLLSINGNNGSFGMIPGETSIREILIANKLLFSGGDGGSKYHRIPAIVTARDGSLITVTDRRWNNPFDLPSHIDLVIRRSVDNGFTWSNAVTLAGEGTDIGYGDAALVLNRSTGDIICLFASGSGFFSSTNLEPIRIFQSKSSTNGLNWTTPKDITGQVYGEGCNNPLTTGWQAAFVTSGTALQLKSGRIMAVLVVRETTTRIISNYILYSDDNADSWKVGPKRAVVDGGEAKMIELENGNILMSVRNRGFRQFCMSNDRGMTWSGPIPQTAIPDPSCNGDLMRFTSISNGYLKNRIFHTIPFSHKRNNLSILLSYDEGSTWPVKKTIYPGASAYSALTILKDGTIGIYYEVGEYETYQMYFARFSLSWLTDGMDALTTRWHNSPNGVSNVDVKSPEINLFPNPADDLVTFTGLLNSGDKLEIYNSSGILAKIVEVEQPINQKTLSIKDLVPGMYIIRIGSNTTRLIVR